MSIFMSKFAGDDYSALQGPCPDGFHIPTKDEWVNVYNVGVSLGIWSTSNGTPTSQYLKLPMVGNRNSYNGNIENQGSAGKYWSCVFNEKTTTAAYTLYLRSGDASYSANYMSVGEGCSIRPFRDEILNPIEGGALKSGRTWIYQSGANMYGIAHNSSEKLISLSSNGTTRYTIADKNLGATTVWNSGDTLSETNCGKYYQRGNNYGFPFSGSVTTSYTQVYASSYGPGNYYNSSTYILSSPRWRDGINLTNLWGGETGVVQSTGEPKKIYIRLNVQPITTSGIYHNEELGLISLSSDGNTWITIADKNLGATQVYNSGDTLSEANCGKYYQWGNNYGFPRTGTVTTSTTAINASNYGPGNYYSSSTFRYPTSSPYYRDNSDNRNLWGDTTNTNEARRGPCAEGYHIPSNSELENILNIGEGMGAWTTVGGANYLSQLLKMPFGGARFGNTLNYQGTQMWIWSSTPYNNTTHGYYLLAQSNIGTSTASRIIGLSIRPFKNDAVQPDDSRTVLYQA